MNFDESKPVRVVRRGSLPDHQFNDLMVEPVSWEIESEFQFGRNNLMEANKLEVRSAETTVKNIATEPSK